MPYIFGRLNEIIVNLVGQGLCISRSPKLVTSGMWRPSRLETVTLSRQLGSHHALLLTVHDVTITAHTWGMYIITAQWRLKSTASRLFAQTFVQAQIKRNIKAPRHWPLWGESTGDRWIPRTKGQLRGKYFHLMTSSCELENACCCHTMACKAPVKSHCYKGILWVDTEWTYAIC